MRTAVDFQKEIHRRSHSDFVVDGEEWEGEKWDFGMRRAVFFFPDLLPRKPG